MKRVLLLSNSQRTTVIVIDDDASVCRALKIQLEILGFSVLVFGTAENMLTGKFSIRDTCMLCDVYLPGINGIELCRRLAERGSHLPTVLMSGRDDDQTRRLIREAKPIATLFKPFDQSALLHAIRKALRHGLKSED